MPTLNLWGEPAYYTTLEGSLAIMRELNAIEFEKKALDWFKRHAPLVVAELRRQGVKFSSKENGEASRG